MVKSNARGGYMKNNKNKIEWGLSLLNKYSISYLEEKLKHRELTKTQILFLIHIRLSDGVRQDYLARMFNMNRSTITRVIKSLIDLGYINKRLDEYNKKANFIYLTTLGYQVCEEIFKAINYWIDTITLGFTDDEVDTSIDIISRMASNACKSKGENYLSELILGRKKFISYQPS